MGAARRCSPTNIGLSLLSALCEADLGVAKPKEAMGVVENLLATVERLPKWNGHLYNWYDTATLKSLHPAYVSSVDSGNLAGCLIVLREGLHEYGRPDLAGGRTPCCAPWIFASCLIKAGNYCNRHRDGKERAYPRLV